MAHSYPRELLCGVNRWEDGSQVQGDDLEDMPVLRPRSSEGGMSEAKLAPWFCLRGHDKNIVGINGNRQCKACKSEQNKRRANNGDSYKRFIDAHMPSWA